jgi:hypothetical protein
MGIIHIQKDKIFYKPIDTPKAMSKHSFMLDNQIINGNSYEAKN